MTSAALGEGWQAWAVPSPIRTRSARSWIPISTFTRFPTGSRRSRPAPWKTASSLRPSARCLRAFTASQTITSSWGEENPSKPWHRQDKWVSMFYTQGQTFPMLLLTKSYFSTFFPFLLVVCNIKSILGNRWRTLRRTASVDTMGCKAWSMDVYFFKRLLHLHKLQDLPYFRFTVQNWYELITLVTYQMMHTWGNAIFQKGVCLFHLNLKKLLPLCTIPLPHCRQRF